MKTLPAPRTTGLRPTRRQALLAAAGVGLLLAACSEKKAEAPDAATPPDGRKAFDTALRGSGFVVGQATSARQVMVFFDPQCPHCAALWKASQPLLDRVRMVWIPIAFVSPKSAPQAAALLSTNDPQAAMDLHESRMSSGQGGLEVQGTPAPELLAKVKANTELLTSLGADSVPYLVLRPAADGPYTVVPGGLPTAELAKLLGL